MKKMLITEKWTQKTAFIITLVLIMSSLATAKWNTSISKDEMTGETSCYASSLSVGPTEKMGFPYSDVKAWIGIGTDGKSEWIYFGFSEAPNLLDTSTEDGYNLIKTRIKWDDTVETVTLTQDWGEKFIHFRNDSKAISNIMKCNSVLLELNWYGEGKTYFKFSLSGSSAALTKIRNGCKK